MVYLVIFQLLIFAGLIFFLRYILSKNMTKATGRLDDLTKDYNAKQEEANITLEQAKRDAVAIVSKAKQEAEEMRDKLLTEANSNKELIVSDAHKVSEEMISKAERSCESLKQEIEDKIESRVGDKACELLKSSLPVDFLKELHCLWMDNLLKGEISLERLRLPEDCKVVDVLAAFSLTDKQKDNLLDKLKKKISKNIKLQENVDQSLMAGVIVKMGSIVIDASLKHKVQEALK